jgi:hypothetical protein
MNQKILLKTSYTRQLLSIDNMPGTYNTRIFVGGNYTCQFVVLLEIQKFVRGFFKGFFTPILAADFDFEKDNERSACLRLLHNCKFAIFELTTSAGQIIEIEAAKDYCTNFITVHNSVNQTSIYTPGINMTNIKDQIIVYRSLDELKRIISIYLVQWKNSLK